MERMHIHSFPAVGSLKERRMCRANIEQAKQAQQQVEALTENSAPDEYHKAVDKIHDVKKGLDALKGEEAYKQAEAFKIADAAFANLQQKIEKNLGGIRKKEAEEISKLTDPQKTNKAGEVAHKYFAIMQKMVKGSDMNAAYVEGLNLSVENAFKTANPALDTKTAETSTLTAAKTATDTAYQEWDAAKKNGSPNSPVAAKLEAYKTALENQKKVAVDLVRTSSDWDKATHLIELGKQTKVAGKENVNSAAEGVGFIKGAIDAYRIAEKHLRELGVVASPDAKKAEVEKTYATEIKAIKDADAKSNVTAINDAVRALNSKTSANDRAAVAGALENTLKNFKVSYDASKNELRVDLADTKEAKEIEEASLIKRIVSMVLKFMGELNLLSPEQLKQLKGKLDDDGVDKKISSLEEEKAKLDPTKNKEQIEKIDALIATLKAVKPLIAEAKKAGVTISVDENGNLKFEGNEKNASKIIDGIARMSIGRLLPGGRVALENMDPRRLQQALNYIRQLGPAYYPGQGAGYVGPRGPGMGMAAGFDPYGNPSVAGGMSFGEKPVWGASDKGSRK